jgi:hypothetical protein
VNGAERSRKKSTRRKKQKSPTRVQGKQRKQSVSLAIKKKRENRKRVHTHTEKEAEKKHNSKKERVLSSSSIVGVVVAEAAFRIAKALLGTLRTPCTHNSGAKSPESSFQMTAGAVTDTLFSILLFANLDCFYYYIRLK